MKTTAVPTSVTAASRLCIARSSAAQWTGADQGPAFFACSDDYLIDVRFDAIVDVDAIRFNHQAEIDAAAKTIIERTEERSGLEPVGDTAYGVDPILNWLVEGKTSHSQRSISRRGMTALLAQRLSIRPDR